MKTKPSKSYVYILCNQNKNVVYIGCTDNLKKRIYLHKKHLISGFTKKYSINRLIYFEIFDSKELALEREAQIKKYRREKKNILVNKKNPDWVGLYPQI